MASRFSCSARQRDALLQLVLQPCEPRRLLLVARGAVGARELVEPVEQRARVAHVASHGGVGPPPVAVPVEPQMQLDQRADVVDHGVRDSAARAARFSAMRAPDDLMVMELHARRA